MALIMGCYSDYFIFDRSTHSYFDNGEVSYFDPIERSFLRIYPSRGESPKDFWIPLPIIREADVFRDYLRLTGRVSILKDYAHLDDIAFSVKVAELADHCEFWEHLQGYLTCRYAEAMIKWIEENHIPNCKPYIEAPLIEIHSKEDVREWLKLSKIALDAEMRQEEDFKKSQH